MDRRHCYVILLIVSLVALQLSGCGGGSSTSPLTVGTSTLPDGTVGITYSANLSVFGGTAPYTWSQTSGGDMPGGVTLSRSGVLIGTPTTAGTFGPYVFAVTDSAGTTASSQNLNIKITATTLSVTTPALPDGTVGTPYSFTLAAGGGSAPYTWTETSGGALPPGLADVTSLGVIAGTPTTAGEYGPYVFTVTDAQNGTATSASLTLTVNNTGASACAPLGNEAALTSVNPYAFLVKGTDGNGNPVNIAGSFTPNGAGGIVSAAVDYNGFTNGPQRMNVNVAGSSYAFSSSGQGCLYLAFSGLAAPTSTLKPAATMLKPSNVHTRRTALSAASVAPVPTSVQFSFGLGGFDGSIYHTGRIVEADNTKGDGTNAAGFVYIQTPSAFALNAFQPAYAFGVDGWTASSNGLLRTAMAGAFTNNSGTLSAGYADLNVAGTPSGEISGGYGTLNGTIDSATGRGTGNYFLSTPNRNLTFDFAFYVLNESDLILFSTDLASNSSTTPLLAGRALTSNPNGGEALNGYYLLASQGLDTSGPAAANSVEAGTLNATSGGVIPAATIYSNEAGTYATTPYPNSSYSVEASSGRVSFTGLTTSPPVVYLTAGSANDDGIAGFLVGTDPQASSGVIVTQSANAPNYSVADVAGNYAASTTEDVDGLNGAFFGAFVFDGAGGYTVTPLVTGSVTNVPNAGTISVNADGSGTLDGGNFTFVTNGQVLFAIPNSGDPLLFVFNAATLPPSQ